jgi:hypothetical protein
MAYEDTTRRTLEHPQHADPVVLEETPQRTRVHRRRRKRRYLRIPRLNRTTTLVLACLLAIVVVFSIVRVWAAWSAYTTARDDARILNAYANRSLAHLSANDIQQIEYRFGAMSSELERLDRATSVPVITGLVEHIPVLGPRYKTGREAIEVARIIATAGERGADVGSQVMAAYDANGISSATPPATPTWLDVVVAREQDILSIADDLTRARDLRAGIDDRFLPDSARVRLAQMDRMMEIFDTELLDADTFTVLTSALGAERPMRYLVLFPNPAEMRMAGGFPGEVALVELERGQLKSYEFHNISGLNVDYMTHRSEKVPLPWAYQHYFVQDGFLIQDAVWIADFADMGAMFMTMYAETGWPPIDGVAAAQASIPADLLSVTGPVTIDVDGDMRRISSANLYDEMERQRRLRLEGHVIETAHKEVIANVGAEIIERLKQSDRSQLARAVKLVIAGADRRDLQTYVPDPLVQDWLDGRRWTGRLQPVPGTPTVAVLFGSLVAHKADLAMQPSMDTQVGPAIDGRRKVTLRIDLQHTGTNEDLPFYSGFHRWWVEVHLPDGATLQSTSKEPQPDPDAPNGGAYLVELFPQQQDSIALTFTMPDADALLIRRQPGVNPLLLSIERDGCTPAAAFPMDGGDVVLALDGTCAIDAGRSRQSE